MKPSKVAGSSTLASSLLTHSPEALVKVEMLCDLLPFHVPSQVPKFCGIPGHKAVALLQGLEGPLCCVHSICIPIDFGRNPNKGFQLVPEEGP